MDYVNFVKKILFLFLSIGLLIFFRNFVYAEDSSIQECRDNNISVERCPSFLQDKVNLLQGQAKTLSSQIAIMNSQISLTEARIEANKRQILDLTLDIDTATKKIDTLSDSLNKITEVLLNRIVATYQAGRVQPLEMLLSSRDASNLLARLNYLRIAQAHDKRLIYDVQQAKNDYTNQKEIYEAKKKKVESLKLQLEAYSKNLEQQKAAKQSLLTVTKNDEEKYQQLLAQARAEFQAIQNIVSGGGSEVEVASVTKGQKIASVVSGQSCNSGGTHLHFIVSRNGSTENPFSYLKSVDYENCSGSSCGSGDADSFNPSGNWDWPLDPRIKMNQGYGATWAIKYSWVGQIYNFHNGIDIEGSSLDVKAVKDGKLYRGSYSGYAGCRLSYVRLKHIDDGLETLYLHAYSAF